MVLTILYSIAGLGIAIVNDFKSIEGEQRALSLLSLPDSPPPAHINPPSYPSLGSYKLPRLNPSPVQYATDQETARWA